MTALRKDALDLLEKMPEDKLYYIVQIMQGVSGLYGAEEQSARDKAIEELEGLRSSIINNMWDAYSNKSQFMEESKCTGYLE